MRSLTILLAAFVLLGLAYSVATPIFETPDELQHYAVVNYVARYKWFPPLGEKPAEHLWDQQALQAPLFYWIAAAATFWIDTSDFSRQAVLQPKANIGDATLPGKKNAFLHGPDQSFPYRGTTLAVHVARWVSVLFGAGTVLLTYHISRFTYCPVSDTPSATGKAGNWLPLLAAGVVAFIPQFIFIHAACSNDSAITFTSTLTLFLLLWIARRGVTLRRMALLGFAIGLMALSKLIGSVLAGVAFGGLLLITRRPAAWAGALAVFGLTAGWWYARNQLVYGDPLALNAFLRFVGGNLEVRPESLAFLRDQFRLLRFSTWGLFGHISVLMQPEWIYFIFDAGAALGLLAFGVGVGRGFWRTLKSRGWRGGLRTFWVDNGLLGVVVLWLAAVLIMGARWFLAAGIQGRLIFPGLPAGAVVWAHGVGHLGALIAALGRRLPSGLWASPRGAASIALSIAVPLALFAGAAVPAYLLPAYSPPPVVHAVPATAVQTDVRFGNEIALRGYTIVLIREQLRLTFYWETLERPAMDYTVAIRLVRPDGSFWLDYVNYPGMGTSLPTTWRPGELRQDDYVFDLNRFPKETAPLRLIVGYFDPGTRSMRPLSHWPNVREKGWATLTELQLTNDK